MEYTIFLAECRIVNPVGNLLFWIKSFLVTDFVYNPLDYC